MMSNHTCTKEMRSEPPRGHEWTLVPSRGRAIVRPDATSTVRRQVEKRILIAMAAAPLTGPALIRLVAGTFDWQLGPDVDLNEGIEDIARRVLDLPLNSLAVAVPRIFGTEPNLTLGGAHSRTDFHTQLLSRVRRGGGDCPCPILIPRCRIYEIIGKFA